MNPFNAGVLGFFRESKNIVFRIGKCAVISVDFFLNVDRESDCGELEGFFEDFFFDNLNFVFILKFGVSPGHVFEVSYCRYPEIIHFLFQEFTFLNNSVNKFLIKTCQLEVRIGNH